MKKIILSVLKLIFIVFFEIFELFYAFAEILGLIFLTQYAFDYGILGIIAICLYIVFFILIFYFVYKKKDLIKEKLSK